MTGPFLRTPGQWRAALESHPVSPALVVEQSRKGGLTLRAGNIQIHSRYNRRASSSGL